MTGVHYRIDMWMPKQNFLRSALSTGGHQVPIPRLCPVATITQTAVFCRIAPPMPSLDDNFTWCVQIGDVLAEYLSASTPYSTQHHACNRSREWGVSWHIHFRRRSSLRRWIAENEHVRSKSLPRFVIRTRLILWKPDILYNALILYVFWSTRLAGLDYVLNKNVWACLESPPVRSGPLSTQ
jgi:hypothetical protein